MSKDVFMSTDKTAQLRTWLVLSNALAKWVEVRPMKNITTGNLCSILDEIFCTFGIPRIILSDNSS